MIAGISHDGLGIEALLKNGLRANHCYSIISVHEVTSAGKKVRLLKCRNPWGNSEWNGNWSDNSKLWTDQLRNQVGLEVSDDGVFFISLEDYVANFTNTNICKYDDAYVSSELVVSDPGDRADFFSFSFNDGDNKKPLQILVS